jgi:hypothetical protein
MLPMSKESIRCPYCESLFNNNEELSKHIDRIHLGSGLLEVDSSKFLHILDIISKIQIL